MLAGETRNRQTPKSLEGHRARLRERFLKSGLESFAEYEVVELLLTLAIPRSDVKTRAKKMIEKFGTLRNILDAPVGELREVPGIGEVAPVALKIIRAAATLYLQLVGQFNRALSSFTMLEELHLAANLFEEGNT